MVMLFAENIGLACLVRTEIYQLCFSFKHLAALLNLRLLQPDPAAAPRTHMALLTLSASGHVG